MSVLREYQSTEGLWDKLTRNMSKIGIHRRNCGKVC